MIGSCDTVPKLLVSEKKLGKNKSVWSQRSVVNHMIIFSISRTWNDSVSSYEVLSYETIIFWKYWVVLKLYVEMYGKKWAKFRCHRKHFEFKTVGSISLKNQKRFYNYFPCCVTIWSSSLVFLLINKPPKNVKARLWWVGSGQVGQGRFITDNGWAIKNFV